MALIFDLESNGLLDTLERIHVLVIHDSKTAKTDVYRGNGIGQYALQRGVHRLQEADCIIGHNIINFDIPAIRKLFPSFQPRGLIRDTIVLSRLIYADRGDRDFSLVKTGRLPAKLRGSHSLKAWGYRLTEFKDDYQGGWEAWNQAMEDYCIQDVAVTVALWNKLSAIEYSMHAIQLEHDVARIIQRQVACGFCFDTQKAIELYASLRARSVELEAALKAEFKSWYVKDKDVIPKVNSRTTGVAKGVPYTKVKLIDFNPKSRAHIADRLMTLYGWQPTKFTDAGSVVVDDDVIKHLDFPTAKLLQEYLVLAKRIGQLAEGKNAWLKLVTRHNRIHGSVNTNGAVTGRATHSEPNLGQVPACGSPFGAECRELFTVPTGKVLVGADLSGLELRCLAHFMAIYDGGEYGRVLLEGDIHTVNQEAAGLPTRNNAKTFIYAFLYGAGDEKIGSIVNGTAAAGKRLKATFLKKTPALKNLLEAVQKAAKARGWIKGLDGRILHIRSAHAALNTLLQSAGALISKQALIEFDKMIIARGWCDQVQQVAWVHDEIQVECDEALGEDVGKMAIESFRLAGEYFNFRIRIDGEYKVGNNWKETH